MFQVFYFKLRLLVIKKNNIIFCFQAAMDIHSQPLDLDFNCMTSTPSKKGSPKSSIVEPIYGNKAVCELNENSEALLGALNGASDIFTNGLSAGERLSGDYDINTVLPPPKSRELAIGESYSDIGEHFYVFFSDL